ncbi:uncharacterized protein [Argopecten irradians]|uniref:uncharacterized protein n=1 Tax=Argopecten irradians TaxID=31199 RepID=UPI0037180C7F
MQWFGILLLAVVMAAPERKSSNPLLGAILNVFHADEVKMLVTNLHHSLESDDNLALCTKECDTLVDGQTSGSINVLGHSGCPLICHSFQEFVHYFDITPQTTTVAPAKRALNPFLQSILNVFHADEVKMLVTNLYHKLGSDDNVALCTNECNTLVDGQTSGSINVLGHSGCPLICNSFQAFVQHFDVTPQTTTVAPAKRALNPFLQSILNVFHADEVKMLVTNLYHKLGSDDNVALCTNECNTLVDGQTSGSINVLGHSGCPLICNSFQAFVQHFDVTPQTTTVAPAKRALNPFLQSILNVFHADEVKMLVTNLYHKLGSDDNVALCTNECNTLVDGQTSGSINVLGHSGCPLICNSFQAFVQHFDVTPQTTTVAPAKRALNPFLQSILNVFHADEVKMLVTNLYHKLGSDDNVALCTNECNTLVDGQTSGSINVLGHSGCPLICNSFQAFVQHFDVTPQTTTVAPAKRALNPFLQSILNVFHADEVKMLVTNLYHKLGSDDNVALCTNECNTLVDGQTSGSINVLGHSGCPLICNSFQAFVQHFDVTPQTTTVAPAKRALNPFLQSILNVFHADEVKMLVTNLYHKLGSDDNVALCTNECNTLVDGQTSGSINVIGHSGCPLICNSFQAFVQHFDVTPQTTTVAPAKRALNPFLQSILNVFHADEVKMLVTNLYHKLGSDDNVALCTNECNTLVDGQTSGSINVLGHSGCPLICNSFQAFVQHFDVTPQTTTVAPAKRALNPFLQSILNVFHADEVKMLVTNLYHKLGSDDNVALCTNECNTLVDGQTSGSINVLGHSGCPLICNSFQVFVQHFDITPQTAVAPATGTSARDTSLY